MDARLKHSGMTFFGIFIRPTPHTKISGGILSGAGRCFQCLKRFLLNDRVWETRSGEILSGARRCFQCLKRFLLNDRVWETGLITGFDRQNS
jgi:hypothetical protein